MTSLLFCLYNLMSYYQVVAEVYYRKGRMCVHADTPLYLFGRNHMYSSIAFNKASFTPPFTAKRRMHSDMEKEMPFPCYSVSVTIITIGYFISRKRK